MVRRRAILQAAALTVASAVPRTPAATNPIVVENAKPGTAADLWQIDGAGDTSILGYAAPYSVNDGQRVTFRIDGPAARVDIYRLGWYGGTGARLHARVTNHARRQPPAAVIPGSNGTVECTAWTQTTRWNVPRGTVSGVFVAVVRSSTGGRSHIPFVVRNDDRAAAVVVKTSDSTWQAYNYFGGMGADWNRGACLYGVGDRFDAEGSRAYAVSWARPVVHRATRPSTALFNAEYPLIRFLEQCGIDVQYIGCQDLDRSADYLTYGRKIFISSGHDEYWTTNMRAHAQAARDAGTHLVFMSGNEAFWRTRIDPAGRMWCFKDTLDGPSAGPDHAPGHVGGQPLDPAGWSGTWRDPRQPGGGDGEVNLTGTVFRMNGIHDLPATIDAARFGSLPMWRNTRVAAGRNITLPVIGFEADELGPGGTVLADTVVNLPGWRADDAGQHYDGTGTMRWGITARRYPSGALSVGFGTVQWSWALDDTHDRGQGSGASPDARQATVNLLADLGAPAATPPAGVRVTAWLA